MTTFDFTFDYSGTYSFNVFAYTPIGSEVVSQELLYSNRHSVIFMKHCFFLVLFYYYFF